MVKEKQFIYSDQMKFTNEVKRIECPTKPPDTLISFYIWKS